MSLPGPIKEITAGDGLVLKLLRQESAAAIYKIIDDNRHYLRKWLPFVDNTWKVEDTEIFIHNILHSTGPKPDIVYEIWYRDDFAGIIALKELDRWNKRTELGYWLDPRFEGMGIMTRCCRGLLDYAFRKLKLHRVQIKAAVGNSSSSRIPEKLGFKFEGIERGGERFPDHFADLEVYSILKDEWLQ